MRFGPDDATPTLTVLNLGAGVQSSTVLLMACEGELPKPDLAIFADTQWEPAAVYEWLEWLEKKAAAANIPLERVTAGDLRGDVLAAVKDDNARGDEAQAGSVGQPPFYVRGKLNEGNREGRLWRKCSTDYKIAPIRFRIRELLGAGPGERVAKGVYAEQWFGISLDEVQRMRTPRDPWAINCYPLIDLRMRRAGCLEWLRDHGYPEPPRSACIGCPFHSDHEWRRLRDETPVEWEDAVAFDAAVREGLPGVKGKAFLHRSTAPLPDVDLTTPEDEGLGSEAGWSFGWVLGHGDGVVLVRLFSGRTVGATQVAVAAHRGRVRSNHLENSPPRRRELASVPLFTEKTGQSMDQGA